MAHKDDNVTNSNNKNFLLENIGIEILDATLSKNVVKTGQYA